MSTSDRKDWILWGALGCALVGTAHSEWSLAVAVGAHPWIATAVPGALDLYVIRALQVRRDVFVAVLAMVAANVAWYLVHSGDLPVDWPLRSAVGAVAPLVVWRVHSLKYTRTRKELLWGLRPGAVSAPVADDVSEASAVPDTPAPVAGQGPAVVPAWVPGYHLDGCDGRHEHEGPVNCLHRATELDSHVPDAVPGEWMAAEYPELYPSTPPQLHSVPDLPAEYAPSAVHSAGALAPGDLTYLETAQDYAANTDAPSVRGLMKYARIGQSRAGRLLDYLEMEES